MTDEKQGITRTYLIAMAAILTVYLFVPVAAVGFVAFLAYTEPCRDSVQVLGVTDDYAVCDPNQTMRVEPLQGGMLVMVYCDCEREEAP